jgi:hypothetical protein
MQYNLGQGTIVSKRAQCIFAMSSRQPIEFIITRLSLLESKRTNAAIPTVTSRPQDSATIHPAEAYEREI